MSLDAWFKRAFGDDDAEAIGSGWWSGVLGVFLGFLAFGAVLCLHFPELLTSPELREVYPMPTMRRIIQVTIGLAFGFSAISGALRRRKTMAVTGMVLSIGAVLLGGSTVEVEGVAHTNIYVGFDWFLLKLMMLALVFVPLERLFPLKPQQSTFREGWTTDAMHLMVSHVGIQVLSMLTVLPATVAFKWAVHPAIQSTIASMPFVAQVLLIVLIVDLVEYWVHRTFHAISWLWPFHAVHHSADSMDWLAGSRIHVVDSLATRTLSFIPIFVLGFQPDAVIAYVIFVSGHAVFIHGNLRWKLRWLEPFVVTPRFHHWHHGADKEAHDKNFAVHFPWIDRVFGTYYMPGDRWPDRVGIDGESPKGGYLAHLVYPFVRRGQPAQD